MLLSQVIEQYKNFSRISLKAPLSDRSMSGYDLDLRQFCLYVHNQHIEFVRIEDINNYFNEMRNLGWKTNSLMLKSVAMRNLFKYATRMGLKVISHELIPLPHREYNIPRVATDEEIEKVLALCPKKTNNLLHIRNRCIINFLKSTGCRNSEMCALNVSQLMEHFNDKRVVIKTAKSRGMRPIRELFWDDEAHESLKVWLAARKNLMKKTVFPEPDALFVGVRNWQTGKRITNSAVAIALRSLSRKAGVITLNAHSFRHYRGHELNDLGANNSTISGVLGHASLASSFVYTQMKSSELKIAAKKYRRGNLQN